MFKQLFFEDVKIGINLPVLKKKVSSQQLVMYAGASGDYYQIHYDINFAKANGLPGVILHGALKNAFLGELITNCIGDKGKISRLLTIAKDCRSLSPPQGIYKQGDHCGIWPIWPLSGTENIEVSQADGRQPVDRVKSAEIVLTGQL